MMTGEHVKQFRKMMGWSQQEFADIYGISRSKLSHYELGNSPIPEEFAAELMKHPQMPYITGDKVWEDDPKDCYVSKEEVVNEVVIETVYGKALKAIKQCEDMLCEALLALEKIELTPETLEVHRGLTKAHEPISRYADKLEEMEANTLKLVKVVSR